VRRGRTVGELRWPNTANFVAMARRWRADASQLLLEFIWAGCDLLRGDVLSLIDTAQAEEDIERNLTQLLVPRVRARMSGFEPFDFEHGPYEDESRRPPPAQPPQYDMAFVLKQNPRVMWPVEAKVLWTDRSVAAYVADVKNEFLTCRYAPFSSEGGMLGYLFSGDPNEALANIGRTLGCSLADHPHFSRRKHKTSDHVRSVPKGKSYPRSFRCHHLVLEMQVTAPSSVPDTHKSFPGLMLNANGPQNEANV